MIIYIYIYIWLLEDIIKNEYFKWNRVENRELDASVLKSD